MQWWSGIIPNGETHAKELANEAYELGINYPWHD